MERNDNFVHICICILRATATHKILYTRCYISSYEQMYIRTLHTKPMGERKKNGTQAAHIAHTLFSTAIRIEWPMLCDAGVQTTHTHRVGRDALRFLRVFSVKEKQSTHKKRAEISNNICHLAKGANANVIKRRDLIGHYRQYQKLVSEVFVKKNFICK